MRWNILMVAFEAGRWGPSRLVQQLAAGGFDVSVLCRGDNALNQSSHISKHHALRGVKSSRSFRARLRAVLSERMPDLVVPCDERAVAALHAVVKQQRAGARIISDKAYKMLVRSLAEPGRLDAVLMKDQTLALARELGIATPQTVAISNADQAATEADELGFPVFVKSAFSWAGLGTIWCNSTQEVSEAFNALIAGSNSSPFKKLMRKLLAREWYPSKPVIELQKAAAGKPAMYCAVALDGKLLAGFSGITQKNIGRSGPSTVVWIGYNKAFEDAARSLIAATCTSGFVGFDFMWDEVHQSAVLLECNPRPIQICHLGETIGVNLCSALANALEGKASARAALPQEAVVRLFPQDCSRDEGSELAQAAALDVPRQDPKLLQFMLQEGKRHGCSFDKLKLALAMQRRN